MLIIISPSKTIKNNSDCSIEEYSHPKYISDTSKIVAQIKKHKPEELQSILQTSYNLALEAQDNYQLWNPQHIASNSTQALFAFKGDVYNGLEALSLSKDTLLYSQNNLLILSGLYGALKPLDLIQPYRLDVANSFKIAKSNLYEFWRSKITKYTLQRIQLQKNKLLINLASSEYFKMIDSKSINCSVITPVFKDYICGQYKIISIYTKKARGKMARFILENQIEDPELLKTYNEDGYFFDVSKSTKNSFIFIRG